MSLLGRPPRAARKGANSLRTALADIDGLGAGVLDAAAPLIEELPTGHYRAHLCLRRYRRRVRRPLADALVDHECGTAAGSEPPGVFRTRLGEIRKTSVADGHEHRGGSSPSFAGRNSIGFSPGESNRNLSPVSRMKPVTIVCRPLPSMPVSFE